MRRALLDVNVLLALLDSDHVDHDRAHDWLDDEIAAGWASCPITENGFVRVLSQPRYPSPVPPAQAIALLSRARLGGHHAFWPCDVSVLDAQIVDRSPTARSTPGDRRLPGSPWRWRTTGAWSASTAPWPSPRSVHGAAEDHLTVL